MSSTSRALALASLALTPLACSGGAPRGEGVTAAAAAAAPPAAPWRPRLVVVLVVDQMRRDYLDRFAHLFTDGLARLRAEGAVFAAATIAHAVTMTSPGHATLVTGAHPRGHGVIQNEWIDRASGAAVYAASDPAATIVGPPGADTSRLEGRSATAMLRPAIGDWLKAQVPGSRVHALAFKDRASVLMGGARPDSARWYEPTIGGYVGSGRHEAALPGWVAELDASAGEGQPWERALPASWYAFAGPDAVASEGDGAATTFPHRLDGGAPAGSAEARAAYRRRLGQSPRGDALTLGLAERMIAAEELGQDDAPDLLLLSLSGADLVGHAFGPESHEVVDYYVRLDRSLGDLLRGLDAALPGAYALVLSSDHGVASLPEVAAARGEDAGRVLAADFEAAIAGALAPVAGALGLEGPLGFVAENEGLWLDLTRLPATIDPQAVRAAAAAALRGLPFVADAFTYEELAGETGGGWRPYLDRYRLGFVAGRSPDVQLLARPGWLVNTRPRGTSHGTPYAYDSDVPIIFFGAGIRAGWRFEPARTVDVAPTIAGLLGIDPPAEVDGRSLAALLR